MRAKLKRIHSPDVENLATFVPSAPDEFGLLLQLMVSPEGQEGEESFDVQICTPRWLAKNHRPPEVLPLRHHVLVLEYDYRKLSEALRTLVESCTGSNWREIAEKVGRIGRWEFEDYSPG